MLTKITDVFSIDFDEVYLVDGHTFENSFLIYLRRFDRIPLEIKDTDMIWLIKVKLTQYLERKEAHEKESQSRIISKDEQSPGEDILASSLL